MTPVEKREGGFTRVWVTPERRKRQSGRPPKASGGDAGDLPGQGAGGIRGAVQAFIRQRPKNFGCRREADFGQGLRSAHSNKLKPRSMTIVAKPTMTLRRSG